MATGGLYGSSPTGTLIAQASAETAGLYGSSPLFGGTYFEWLVFQVSATAPATPTGGSWDFVNNVGTPPTGWSNSVPSAPANTVWTSIALVNSKSGGTLTWSTPGIFGNFTTTTVGTTTTLSPGSSATVSNSGDRKSTRLNSSH